MAGLNWWRRQYDDIKGNLKWSVICSVGTGLALLLHWLSPAIKVRFHVDVVSWLGIIAPVASIIAVFYLVSVLKPRKVVLHTDPAQSSESAVESAPATVVAPLDVDMQGTMLELYFWKAAGLPELAPTQVLLKVQIVNRGPVVTTITSISLQISIGLFVGKLEVINIPAAWCIKRRKQGLLNIVFEETPLIPPLIAEDVYTRGIPRIGWVAFEGYLGNVEFPNAQFDLELMDSMGGLHHICRKPSVYEPAGVLAITQTGRKG